MSVSRKTMSFTESWLYFYRFCSRRSSTNSTQSLLYFLYHSPFQLAIFIALAFVPAFQENLTFPILGLVLTIKLLFFLFLR